MRVTRRGVTARPPRNLFPLDEHAPYSVLIGGGIGIAPLLAMRRRLIQLQRPYQLHAAFRGLDHLLLGEPLFVTAESARKVIAVLDLAEQSSKQGGAPVKLPFEQ